MKAAPRHAVQMEFNEISSIGGGAAFNQRTDPCFVLPLFMATPARLDDDDFTSISSYVRRGHHTFVCSESERPRVP